MTGGFLYHRRLAEKLPDFGFELEFLSFPEWRFPCPAAALPWILGRLMRARPAAVIVDSLIAAYFSPLTLWKRPFVGIVHQAPGGIDHGPWRTAIQSYLDRFVYRRAEALIACSGWLAETLSDFNGRIVVAEPGCESLDRSGGRFDLRGGRQDAILSVANWQPVKGLESLLEAFSCLPEELATLHLVGDRRLETDYGRAIWERVSQPDLESRVVVHGCIEPAALGSYYSSADLFALASKGETYGSVYAEALSAGLPIVGWKTGNLPHLIDHEVDGLLVDFGRVEELADSLRRLCVDPTLRGAMSQRALARASNLPSWTDTTRKVLEALNVGA